LFLYNVILHYSALVDSSVYINCCDFYIAQHDASDYLQL